MPDVLFQDVRLIDPASGLDQIGGLLVRDGRIADLGPALGRPDGVPVLEGRGAILCPGLVDMRANLGEPGFEYRETVASAAAAASSSGITTLAALPDSRPALDDAALVHLMRNLGEETGAVTVLPYGAVTRACAGEEMAELGLLCEAGAVAFTDGQRAVADARMMRLALSYARGFDAMIVQHPEDPVLAAGGAATEGELATRLGLPGIPAAAEAIMVARDIRLAQLTGGSVHFAHVSTADALLLIRRAKDDGLRVTCDTAPPYFDLNETAIGDFRTYAKLSPPLRPEADRLAVCAALADGTIDAIASDHQPRDADDKRQPFALASPGGSGLATLLGVTLAQVHGNGLPLLRALALLSSAPAALLRSDAGRLEKGAAADLCLFDLELAWKVEAGQLPGKSPNTPFDGRALEGRVIGTWKAGRRVWGMIPILLAASAGYLLGSIPFGYLLTRLAGLGDIRAIGSGSIGATNVLRTGRKGIAAATVLLDVAKGTAAVLLASRFGDPLLPLVAAFAAVLGHCTTIWLGGRGGKGVATALGALLGLAWPVALACGALWLAVAFLTRMSSASSLAASAAAPALMLLLRPWPAAAAVALISLLIIVRHHANIRRLLAGTEPRIGAGA